MRVEIEQDIDSVRKKYGHILAYAGTGRVFCSIEWFSVLSAHGLSARFRPRVYVLKAGDSPLCILFCMHDRQTLLLTGLANYYSLEFQPVFTEACSDRRAALDAIFDCIAAERPRWRGLSFGPLHPSGDMDALIAGAARRAGFAVRTRAMHENYTAAVTPGDFDSYRRTLPSRLRNTLDRRGKKAARLHAVEFVYADRYDPALVADYHRVYERSWKLPERHDTFIDAMCRVLAETGCLRLALLYFDGHPVAAQIWLIAGGRGTIYKLAHDEDYRSCSPGSLLTEAAARAAIEQDRVEGLDFGAGEESYKASWMTANAAFRQVEAVQWRTPGGCARLLRWAASRLRRAAVPTGRRGSPA